MTPTSSINSVYLYQSFSREGDILFYFFFLFIFCCSFRYKWTKDNADFDVSSSSRLQILPSSGTLHITNASRTDHGLYQCQAINHLGTSLSRKVNVVFAFYEAFKSMKPESISGNEGLPLSLKCPHPYMVPKPSVYWTNVGKYDNIRQSARVQLNERIALDYDGKNSIHRITVLSVWDLNYSKTIYCCISRYQFHFFYDWLCNGHSV